MELFPYQVEGAKFLASRKRALLADEMGLGKSAQAIAACDSVGARQVLVICPASVRENWKREFAKFSASGVKPIVQSYNNANAINTEPAPGCQWDALILDEAHYLKNPKAKRTQAIFGPKCDGVGGLVERATHVFLLTGTPTPNNPSELWSMLRAVVPEAIGRHVAGMNGKPMSYWSFVTRYCKTRDNGFGIQIVGGKNLDELKARIAPYVLRRKKDDVLKDLPPIRFDELPIEGKLVLPQDCATEMRLLQKTLEEKGVEGLREIAPHVAQLRRLTGLAKVPGVIEWVKDWIDGGGDKLVIFAHHRDVIDALCSALAHDHGFDIAVVHGGTTDRQGEVDRFQTGGGRLFVGQIQAAGVGITLTAASDALFVESSWTPAENDQAAMRIHRIGQRNACLVRYAMLAGSIDEQIQRAVMRKSADIARLFS